MKRLALLTIILLFAALPARAICNAKFINPITDVCWDCVLPIKIGGIPIGGGRASPTGPSFPLCVCGTPFPRIGISVSLWEPARMIDVANEAGCFVNLGFDIDFGLFGLGNTTATSSNGVAQGNKYHAHYYISPLISWLGILVDGLCLDTNPFDLAYMSELDPLWADAELNTLLNPESILFANPIAEAACAADCVASSSGNLPRDELFWCNGCGGGMYPLAGEVGAVTGGVMGSQQSATKLVARMHRVGISQKTSSNRAMCRPTYAPIIPKSQYRWQMTAPRAATSGRYACMPTGASTQLMEMGREFPFNGESFGWLMWRHKTCCAL